MNILGISAYYHDAAAALVRDGDVIAAAEEERFTRVKHDPSLPKSAIEFVLGEGEVAYDDLDAVVFYEKPLAAFGRVLRSFAGAGPAGLVAWPRAATEWLRSKLWVSYEIERCVRELGYVSPKRTLFADHHTSHAAAAFYPSPFETAAILTFDGVGEWATTTIGRGLGRRIELIRELRYPSSLGLLYAAFTAAAGFKVNSGEYKLMGLAPYGEPRYRQRILDELIDLRDDGSFTTNMDAFAYLAGRRMTNRRFDQLFDGAPRDPDGPITRRECDLARSIQVVIEEIVLRTARHGHELTGESRAVLAGGVALNCVSNARLLAEGPFDELWIQPASGDSGSAVGCALWAWHEVFRGERKLGARADGMHAARLGPRINVNEVQRRLSDGGRPFEHLEREARDARIAELLADGQVVALCQGRMEFGPRALGGRSILADPRIAGMQTTLNTKTKHRESFRPFAPSVLAEHADEWFALSQPSPYMLLTAPVRGADLGHSHDGGAERSGSPGDQVDLGERLASVRSPLPAVTHVDGSARVQTVSAADSPDFHGVLDAFFRLTGCPVLLNTSFNVRGEPIVCDDQDAYRCFMTTDIDWLVIEDFILDKRDQPTFSGAATPTVPD